MKEETVDVGAGILLPTYVTGPSSHGWWAMVILLVVAAMIFAMAVFSFFYLYGVHPSLWVAPAGRITLAIALPAYILAAGGALLARYMLARAQTQLWTPGVVFFCAALALAAGIGIDLWSWLATGLRPDASGQGAVVYALLGLEAILAAVGLLMAAYIAARNSRGMIVRPRNNSLDMCVLWIVYAAGQGSLTALLTRAVGG